MDRYTIHRFLGNGAFGAALLVAEKATGHQFVIKTVPAKTLSPKEKEFALKEVKILSSLQHKNVVRFIDYFEENGTLHIVQEYCDGGELNVVNGTCMEEKKIWGYLAQICLGLKYLHSQKVLHRDLKPANIFLTKNDDLKLGDFGLSKKLPHSLAMTTSFVGTPIYLSPEICERKEYNSKCDMWSLGVLLYSMASGSPPFLEDDHDKTFEAIKTSPYKPLESSITKELRDIIYSLLNKNPDYRPSAVDLLKIPVLRTTALRFCSPDELVDTKQTPVWKKLPNMEPVDKLADEFGLSFNDDGELVEETGEKYQFQKFPGEANKNQQRYDQVGRLSLNIVQQVMEVELKKVYFHKDKRGTYIFVSEGYEKRSELLVLMQGSGVVRAGQWSRRLLLNDSIDKGTQLPYIRKGLANGWGIIVMNPNDNYPLEGCRDANEHARYVWKHFIEGQLNIKKIAIVAHSAGGGIVSHLLQAYTQDFHRRVLAIAFTEATYSKVPSSSQKYVESVTRNWVANGKLLGDTVSTAGILAVSAGTTVHEETSHNAIDDVFRYIWLKFAQGFPS